MRKLSCVCAVVDHTNSSEEKGRHQSMRHHLHYRTGNSCLSEHSNAEKNKTTMANRRVCIDILQIGLHHRGEGSVQNCDRCKNDDDPGILMSSRWHQECSNAQTTVTP